MSEQTRRNELAVTILRAADDDKPVWEAGLNEIVDAVLAFFSRADASICEHCGGESWHHTIECYTGVGS